MAVMGFFRIRRGTMLLLAWTSLCSFSTDSHALLIDDFSTAQGVNALDPQATDANQVIGAGIVGSERDLEVTRTSGFLVTMGTSAGRLVYGQVGGGVGSGRIAWDGTDSDAALDPSGLGGVDFGDGGASSMLAIELLLDDVPIDVVLVAYTDAANSSTATVSLPGGIPPAAPVTLLVDFADFGVLSGSGVDFSNVGAFELLVDGSALSSVNIEFEAIRTIPEPAPALLVAFGLLALALLAGPGRRRGRDRISVS